MTQKQECLCYCIDHLESRSLGHIFDANTFNQFFEKNNYPGASAYNIGMSAADAMIENPILEPQTATHE